MAAKKKKTVKRPQKAVKKVSKKAPKRREATPPPKPRIVRKPTRKEELLAPQFSFILFGDLHVRSETLDRSLATLRFIRKKAAELGVDAVICQGDFWHTRGILQVRQVDALQDELELHQKQGLPWIMIPGNHDQVDREGRIHGLRIFAPYSNIEVISEPTARGQLAFIPWIDDPEKQRATFAKLSSGATVFAHAEAPGSLANNGHKMEGRFELPSTARAVYLSHFHKRQKIGDRTWYIGSPYEQDMGERNSPKGIAYVSSARIEPEWFEVPEMPKHFQLHWPEDAEWFSKPAERDIVEVISTKDSLEDPDYQTAVEAIRAVDVREFTDIEPEDGEQQATAWNLDQAIDAYAESNEGPLSVDGLKDLGRQLQQLVPHDRPAPLGSVVEPCDLRIEGFANIPGQIRIDLLNRGMILLQGEMGSGKTSILDAATWCLFDTTTPKKAGSPTSTFKGDEVIHDSGEECLVEMRWRVGGDTYGFTRKKKRGRGSRLTITRNGKAWDSGVSDSAQIVLQVIGLDYELWRACVSLGQGDVADFVTDAGKRRSESLLRAFGLESCPKLLAVTRKERKKLEEESSRVGESLVRAQAHLETLKTVQFDSELAAWETSRKEEIDRLNARIAELAKKVGEIDAHLQQEQQWKEYLAKAEAQIAKLERDRQLAQPSARQNQIHAALGAANTELGITKRELQKALDTLQKAQGNSLCTQCGQPLPADQYETMVAEHEQAVQTFQLQVQTHEGRISQLQVELGQLTVDPVRLQGIDAQLKEAREVERKGREAVAAFDRIRSNRENCTNEWNRILKTIQQKQAEANPWQQKKDAFLVKLQQAETEVQEAWQLKKASDVKVEAHCYWEHGFGSKGIPAMVLRAVMHDLEVRANWYLSKLTEGKLLVELTMTEEGDISTSYAKRDDEGELWERNFTQLSGGEKRCVRVAFAPLGLSQMIFNRLGVAVNLLMIDELTTHMSERAKAAACQILAGLKRSTVLVADHDPGVRGLFDTVVDVENGDIRAS